MAEHDHWLLGRREPRVDGLGKVTGEARFADDLDAFGQAYGKVLRAGVPHARILSLDVAAARTAPGVVAVVTARDVPGSNLIGGVKRDHCVLADDRVRYEGDAVALVAAETEEQAEAALALIRVEYERLPVVTDPRDALRPDAPRIHDDGNLTNEHLVLHGEPDTAFDGAWKVYERHYETQRIEHAYIEPEAIIATPVEGGGVEVVGSVQNLFSSRKGLAAVLGVPLNRVTVRHAVLGGSFGGKDDGMTILACRAALLARACGRPVKMTLTREESMRESYKRHPYFMDYKVALEPDGSIRAMHIQGLADAGAYCSMTPFVTFRSVVQATGPYRCPNVRTEIRGAYTNNVYTGAMRGFGAPQVNFAIESLVDEIAEDLGLDPLAYRRQIGFRNGDVTATGQVLAPHKVSLLECLDKVAEASDFAGKWRRYRDARGEPGPFKRGIGLACSYRGVALGAEGVDAAAAMVQVQGDGSVIVSCGITDMGQGAQTAVAQCAAEILGVPLSRVLFLPTDTSRIPDSGPTVASRGTIMGGSAAHDAASQVRDRMLGVAAEVLGLPAAGLTLREGLVMRVLGGGSYEPTRLTFDALVGETAARGRALGALGWFKSWPTSWHEHDGHGDAYFTWVYAANVAEVVVDTGTGRVRVEDFWAAHDVGQAVNRMAVEGQIHGGISMGVGYGILEEFEEESGLPKQVNFDEYLIATAMDVPRMHVSIVENPDPSSAFGQKSIGEPATEIVAPAVVNAIANATGRRIREIPAVLERVLLGRKLQRTGPRGSEAARPTTCKLG